MRRLLHILLRSIQVLAWLIFVSALGLLVVEESGYLTRSLREVVSWRLGPLGEGLSIESVNVRWFEPGLELNGVRLEDPNDPLHAELIYLRQVHLTFAPDLQARALARAHVNGGRVTISEELFGHIEKLTARVDGEGSSSITGGAIRRPPMLLTRFEVALKLPSGQNVDLGEVSLSAKPVGKQRYAISGELKPRLAGAVAGESPIHVRGELGPVRLTLEALGKDLALKTAGVRIPPSFGSLPVEDFSGLLTLSAKGQIRFGSEFEVKGDLRAAVTQARLLPRAGDPWLEALRMDVDIDSSYRPELNPDIWARDTWRAAGRLQGDWNGSPLECWAQMGSEVPVGSWARVFARVPKLSLSAASLAAMGVDQEGLGLRHALEPRGDCDASLELSLERGREPKDNFLRLQRLATQLDFDGHAGLTFQGFVDPELMQRMGIPIPVEELRGAALITLDPSREAPLRIAMPELTGKLPTGSVQASLGITTNPAPQSSDFKFELDFRIPETELDDSMVQVLKASPITSSIWVDFDPRGGRLATDWRLWQGNAHQGITGEGNVSVRGTELRWVGVPVPIRNVEGELKLRWSGISSTSRVPVSIVTPLPGPLGGLLPSVSTLPRLHRAIGVSFEFRNDRVPPSKGPVARVMGYVRSEPLAEGHEPPVFQGAGKSAQPIQELIQELSVEIDELLLSGEDWDVLCSKFKELKLRRDELKANGSLGLSLVGSQARDGAPYLLDIEASTRTVVLTPDLFPHTTRDVRGRLLFRSNLKDESTHTRFDLYGRWPQGTDLAASGLIPQEGIAHVSASAGGIDPNNSAFRGALLQVLNQDDAGTGERVDMSNIALSGQLDFHLNSSFGVPDQGAAIDSQYDVRLRSSSLESEDLKLSDLRGELHWADDLWSARQLEAKLGGHPIQLNDLLMYPLQRIQDVARADPMLLRTEVSGGKRGLAVQANISTLDFPLDEQHLSNLLDEKALAPLRENQDFKGLLDLNATRLLITLPEDRLVRVRMHGPMRAHDMLVPFGFEVRLKSADVQLSEFVAEQGSIRAWGAITGLDAVLAERELTGAKMNFSFVDSRLTIDNLEGDFEGGRLVSEGAFGQGARKAIGVDITEPHRFDISLRLEQADVSRLMRGIFESSIADTGDLTLSLQLSGALNDVLGLTGRGDMDLRDGRLWSIPAARELFSQLGFPNTGVFNRLQARFILNDGVFETHDLRVRSALLKLVGTGRLDLDGELAYDLDVRYGILDKLGILNRVLYWLNRGLWRVSIRGDFSRPVVLIKSSFVEFLLGKSKNPRRTLPLPAFAPLAPRF